jgi:N-acylneuraminate cytidylyltransferase
VSVAVTGFACLHLQALAGLAAALVEGQPTPAKMLTGPASLICTNRGAQSQAAPFGPQVEVADLADWCAAQGVYQSRAPLAVLSGLHFPRPRLVLAGWLERRAAVASVAALWGLSQGLDAADVADTVAKCADHWSAVWFEAAGDLLLGSFGLPLHRVALSRLGGDIAGPARDLARLLDVRPMPAPGIPDWPQALLAAAEDAAARLPDDPLAQVVEQALAGHGELSAAQTAELRRRTAARDPYREYRTWAFLNRIHPAKRGLTVVHVPARSGSSRCPGKNVRPLAGRPLLAWTVVQARALPGVDMVVLDTDSPEYAAIGREHGAEVLSLRPVELSGDKVTPFAALVHTLAELVRRGQCVEKLIDCYPTSPFRRLPVMARLVRDLDEHAQVLTACPVALDPSRLLLGTNGSARFLDEVLTARLPGGRYVKTTGHFVGLNLRTTSNTWRYHFLTDPDELVDIDREDDFARAEAVMAKGFDFGGRLC